MMLRESEIFAGRMACLKTDDGSVVRLLITLLVKRPMNVDHLTGTDQQVPLRHLISTGCIIKYNPLDFLLYLCQIMDNFN